MENKWTIDEKWGMNKTIENISFNFHLKKDEDYPISFANLALEISTEFGQEKFSRKCHFYARHIHKCREML